MRIHFELDSFEDQKTVESIVDYISKLDKFFIVTTELKLSSSSSPTAYLKHSTHSLLNDIENLSNAVETAIKLLKQTNVMQTDEIIRLTNIDAALSENLIDRLEQEGMRIFSVSNQRYIQMLIDY